MLSETLATMNERIDVPTKIRYPWVRVSEAGMVSGPNWSLLMPPPLLTLLLGVEFIFCDRNLCKLKVRTKSLGYYFEELLVRNLAYN